MAFDLMKKVWWGYIEDDLKDLLKESVLLLTIFEERAKAWKEKGREEFSDYSFVVFPAAKAYEGFLKKMFLDQGFITSEEYAGKHFRIGRALNPSLENVLREKESVYDRISAYCGGKDLANELWETWRISRNQIFHWFPGEKNVVNLEEADQRVEAVLAAMDGIFKECKINK
jgi:hypothetical protein